MTRRHDLPTASEFRRRSLWMNTAFGLGALALICAYLLALLELPDDLWLSFWKTLALAFSIAVIVSDRLLAAKIAPLLRCLEVWHGGTPTPAELRAGYASASNLPYDAFRLALLDWAAGASAVIAVLWLGRDDLRPFTALAMFGATLSTGFLCALLHYLVQSRYMAGLRDRLAREIPDPIERGALVHRVSLGTKLRLVIVGITVVSIAFATLLAVVRAGRPIEQLLVDAQGVLLEALAAAPAETLDQTLDDTRSAGVRLRLLRELVLVDPATRAIRDGAAGALSAVELRHVLDAGLAGGDSIGVDSEHVYRWRTLPSGQIAVASISWDEVRGDFATIVGVCIALMGIGGALGLMAAHLLGREVDRSARSLREAAERIADGDLGLRPLEESEDELGDVARSFAEMLSSLRSTIGRVAEAANRVEAAAGEIATASDSVAEVTADQMRGLQLVTGAMDRLSAGVTDVAGSASSLNGRVEQSSESIVEMGTLADELNRTASILSGKVDEVSSSIEQMIESVRQVAQSVETLADASEGTSSSMEEMATSLREVDANAAETAKLSSRVVATAEAGRERVRQTIVGMETIHETTETAERIIRGLGERTKEIGAIVDVIDDVADETNLLALNAAIIAAQAGEHGRAFSVVADQIKDLADRVLASTKEIADLIRTVQSETANAISAVEQGSRSVQDGVDLSAEAGLALEEITGSARESGTRIGEIVSAVREQARAAGHVVGLMEKVRSGVERIREAGREQERGNQRVHDNARALRDAAMQVHATSEDQARGSAHIRQSVAEVRQAMERIHRALHEQAESCRETLGVVERVGERTRSNEDAARRLEGAMRGILREAEALRADVRRFRMHDRTEGEEAER